MLFRKNSRIDQFANNLAERLSDEFDKAELMAYVGGSLEKKQRRRVESRLREQVVQLLGFKDEQRLGVYGKARLHMTLMNRLGDLGFSREEARQLNQLLLVLTP